MAVIRRATSGADSDEVARLADEIWREHYPPIIGEAQVEHMLAEFQSADAIRRQMAEGQEYYLIVGEGGTEGYFALAADATKKSVFLSKIYVRRSARGGGLGRAALEFIESRARELGARHIWLTVNKHNAGTIGWYERHGFRKVEEIVKDIGGGFVMDDFWMEKTLDSLEKPTRGG